MADTRLFLTPEEVANERYRGKISVGTLRNWRVQSYGPAFVRVGKTILYPVDALEAFDRQNTVITSTARKARQVTDHDQE
jgi:hypothetical protein